jgi:DNA-binding MarR family transcriptional regulator
MRVITNLARQCGLPETEGCVIMFTLMTTSRIVDRWLATTIKEQGIPRLKLHALITLLASHPEPMGQAELARLLSSEPRAVAGVLGSLVSDGLAAWCSDPDKNSIHLTPNGLTFARHAVLPILGVLYEGAATLTLKERYQLAQTCTQICTCLPASP